MSQFKNYKKLVLHNKYLAWVQLFTNWLFQGIFLADTSEKIYKISFTIILSILAYIIFKNIFDLSFFSLVLLSFVFAHTINWIINANQYVLFIHRMKYLSISKKKLFQHLEHIKNRFENVGNKDWILYVVSHGGICEGTLNEHSDIDVSIIRKPGLKNMIKAILFYVKEKKLADLNHVPLDIFICDTPENCKKRSNWQKNPIVLLDPENKIDTYYPEKLKITINEAKKLNKLGQDN